VAQAPSEWLTRETTICFILVRGGHSGAYFWVIGDLGRLRNLTRGPPKRSARGLGAWFCTRWPLGFWAHTPLGAPSPDQKSGELRAGRSQLECLLDTANHLASLLYEIASIQAIQRSGTRPFFERVSYGLGQRYHYFDEIYRSLGNIILRNVLL
jgi:hypothetical protein